MLPFISCICPTYKRPELLKNTLACYLAQDYPQDRRELIILDDAGQYDSQTGDGWRLISTDTRYPSLPAKFNAIIERARGDVIAIWEDDDMFLPQHLSEVAKCYLSQQSDYMVPRNVWSTYAQEFGQVQREDATNRFHSSWRFTRALFDSIGGYPETEELSFDQQLGSRLRASAGGCSYYGEDAYPSYVYRWGNGYWHGSQNGDGEAYSKLWNHLESLKASKQAELQPVFDQETLAVFQSIDSKKIT